MDHNQRNMGAADARTPIHRGLDSPRPAPMPDGWRASNANHVVNVDLPGVGMTRLVGVEIYVVDEMAHFILNLDGMTLARVERNGIEYWGPDAASYRAAALAWAVQTLGEGVMLPLDLAAREAQRDAEALRIVRTPPETALALATDELTPVRVTSQEGVEFARTITKARTRKRRPTRKPTRRTGKKAKR